MNDLVTYTIENPPELAISAERKIILRWLKGRWTYPARELGRVLGYSGDGKRLVDNIAEKWAAEFKDEVHCFRGDAGGGTGPVPPSGGRQPNALQLTEEGVYLVALKTETPIGVNMRDWLSTKVLPSIRKTDSYSLMAATPGLQRTPPAIDTKMQERVAKLEHGQSEILSVLGHMVEQQNATSSLLAKLVEKQDSFAALDAPADDWTMFFEVWWSMLGGGPQKPEVLAALARGRELLPTIASGPPSVISRKLVPELKRRHGRIIGGYRILSLSDRGLFEIMRVEVEELAHELPPRFEPRLAAPAPRHTVDQWDAFARLWHERFGVGQVLARPLAEMAHEAGLLPETLDSKNPAGRTLQMTQALKNRHKQTYAGLRIQREHMNPCMNAVHYCLRGATAQ